MTSRSIRTITCLSLLILGAVRAAVAQSAIDVVHVFDGTDGAGPGGLTEARDGLLYGTTRAPGNGTIFRVAPDGSSFQTLYVFGAGGIPTDGASPSRVPLVQDAAGYLYGTTSAGGASSYGSVFRLDVSGTAPAVTILHSFDSQTRHPESGLLLSSGGVLYGTTAGDGIGRLGTIYRMGLDGSGFEVLYEFNGGDGARPAGTLIEASDGWLYGTTEHGGANGAGTVFRIGQDGTGFESLAAVHGSPAAGLTEVPGSGGVGYLYGVQTGSGSDAPYGRLFRLRMDTFAPEFLSAFNGGTGHGAFPRSPLLLGRDGALYGTSSTLASGCDAAGCGVVFRVLASGEPQAIHLFALANGGSPDGALVLARDGHLYGTASIGGTPASGPGTGEGVVWTVRDPGRVPLVFTGPGNAFEGGGVSYFLSLDNTTTSRLQGPFVVDVSPSAGLQLAVQPPLTGWTCTVEASGLSCVWPSDLPPGARTDTAVLSFDLVAPFTADCGIGPSPCVTAGARLRDMGVTVNLIAPVTTMSNAHPLPADDAVFAVGDLATTVNVLDNDADPDGDTLSLVEIVVPPLAGQVVFTSDGSVTYRPFGALTGPDTFRYRVSDGRGATATAMVTVTPRIPTLSTSKTRVDIGPVAVGRVAAGRTTVFSDFEISGPVRFEHVSPQTIQAALAGTGYDLADAVSDPDAFRTQFGRWGAWPQGSMLIMYYRPQTVGRVSVARAVLASDIPGLESVTRSVIIVGAAADPATAPLRAADDMATTPSGTPVVVDVLANDGGLSGGLRPLYVSFSGACPSLDFFDGICDVQGPALGGGVTAPPSITGPQPITVLPLPADATGSLKTLYAASELEACFDPPRQPGACLLEGNMYFATLTVNAVPRERADLGVSLGATPGAVPLGEAVTVTVTVTNAGPDTARTVMFTGLGLLGVHHTFERVTPSRGICFSYDAATGLVCAMGDLAAGQSAAVEVVARASAQVFDGVTDPQVGVLLSGSVASDTDDPDGANNARFTSYVVRHPRADLGVSLTATPGAVPLGDAVTVTVTVSNAGPDTARTVMFTGLGLLGVHHAFERVTPSRGICFSYDAATGLVCALGDLAAGQSATVEVVARASAQVFDGVTDSQVSVLLSGSVASDTDDPDAANNARFTSYVVRRAQVQLIAAHFADGLNTVSGISVGDAVDYVMLVSNTGGAAATFSVATQLPVGLAFDSVPNPVCTPAGRVVTCTGSLDAGALAFIPLRLVAGAALMPQGQYTVTVTVTSTLESAADPASAMATASIVVRQAGLRLVAAEFATPQGAALTEAHVGDVVDFRVGIANVGDVAGTMMLTFTLPAPLLVQPRPLIPGSCTVADLTFTCTLTVPARTSGMWPLLGIQLGATLVPTGQTSAPFTLQATLTPAETPAFATAGATLTVHTVPMPQPRFRLVAAEFATVLGTPVTEARVGDVVELRVGLANVGDAAGPFSISTTLPAGIQFAPVLGSSPTCAVADLTVTCATIAPAGFSGVLSLVRLQLAAVLVPAGQSSVPFTLQATLDMAESQTFATASATLTVHTNTPAGNAVTVQPMTSTGTPAPVAVTFSSVTRGGQTIAEPVAAPPPVPSGFRVASLVYDITTTAAYTAPVTVCIDGSFGGTDYLLHFEGGAWVQLPNQRRLPAGGPPFTRVCADTTSLSPFVVATRERQFAFEGLFRPVRNPPVVNTVKAGSTIPVRFSLGGYYGLAVFAPGFPQPARVGCRTGLPERDADETDPAIRSGLTYNPFTRRYIYLWKTHKAMAGACWQLTLRFTDGTEASALFKIR